jgi:predicted acetyltransferase
MPLLSQKIQKGAPVLEFIECTQRELQYLIQNHKLDHKWKMAINNVDPLVEDPLAMHVYKIVFEGNIIGLIDVHMSDMYEPEGIEIDLFEVIEKGKGYGRKSIEEFLNKQVQGYSVFLLPENKGSAAFWEKLMFKPTIINGQPVFCYRPLTDKV